MSSSARHRQRGPSWIWPVAVVLASAGLMSVPLGMAARSAWIGHWPRAVVLLAISAVIVAAGCLLTMYLMYRQGQQGQKEGPP